VKEFYEGHNRNLNEYHKPPYDSKSKEHCKLYLHNRKLFSEQLAKTEKKKNEYYPEKQDMIDEIKQKIQEEKEEKEKNPPLAKTIESYKARGGNLPYGHN
jgi:hypothetical protein